MDKAMLERAVAHELEHVPFGTDTAEVLALVARDGGVILDDILTTAQLEAINRDIDPQLAALSTGTTNAAEHHDDFHGKLTKRLTNLVTHSKVFRDEVMANEGILRFIDAMLAGVAESYWMTTAQVIELHPGQKAQTLHRDIDNYPFFNKLGNDGPEVQTNLLIALTEFTDELGATRIIPRSHLWEDYSDRGSPEMTIPAVMRAGSGLLITGKVVHGGGANRTTDRRRRGLSLAYNPGWLVPEEAYPFIVPMEIARELPPRAQQLIGFRSFHNAGNGGGSLWQNNYVEIADYLKL